MHDLPSGPVGAILHILIEVLAHVALTLSLGDYIVPSKGYVHDWFETFSGLVQDLFKNMLGTCSKYVQDLFWICSGLVR